MPEFDPSTFDPAILLTSAGAVVAATIIANVIQVLKRAPVIGTWIDAKHEPQVAFLISLALIGYAYAVTDTTPLDPIHLFTGFLSWVGVALLATKASDVGVVVPGPG